MTAPGGPSATGGGPAGHDFVRPFIMTKGRTKAVRTDLRFETLVQRSDAPVPTTTPSEQVALLHLSDDPISVAELAAALDLVIGVVNVLINDLLDAGLLVMYESEDIDHIELGMLNRIADKIRSL